MRSLKRECDVCNTCDFRCCPHNSVWCCLLLFLENKAKMAVMLSSCTGVRVQSALPTLMFKREKCSFYHSIMFACSAESTMPDMDNNPSPLRPNSKQGQANERCYRPEVMGGGGMAVADYWACLMKTASRKQSWVNQGRVDKKWRWKKQGMTVSDIKGLFWSTDERLIMINAS